MSYLPYAPLLPNVCFHLIFQFVGRSVIPRERIARLQQVMDHKPLYFSSYTFAHELMYRKAKRQYIFRNHFPGNKLMRCGMTRDRSGNLIHFNKNTHTEVPLRIECCLN